MTVGRLVKFKTAEEMQAAPNGVISYAGKKLESTDFHREKDLQDFLVVNIEKFCREILGDELVEYKEDHPFIPQMFGPRTRRVDLYIRGKNKVYIVELKNPKNLKECRDGIGQILDYGREFPDPEKELLLISTKFDINTARTIKHYGIPIRYFFMSKRQFCEYMGDS